MPHSYSNVMVHIVYSTKDRRPFITESIRPDLYAYTIGILNKIDCRTITIGGASDHIHALVRMSRMVSQAKMVEDMKRGSSRWIKTQGIHFQRFSWQNGYSIFSVSESQASRVEAYIDGQEEHHRKITFQDELRALLKKHNIPFDEKYLWF